MTVVTAVSSSSGNPSQGFYHPDANFASVNDGHLTLWTHHGGDQVAIYQEKCWMQIYQGQKIKHIGDWRAFLEGEG